MRGKILQTWPDLAVISRACLQVGAPVTYHLEYPNGGTDPESKTPADPHTMFCDCIGFATWCAGFDRFQPGKFPLYDGYINTDSMIMEAMGPGKWFRVLDKPAQGCFIVGASYKKLLRTVIGHIGVVTETEQFATQGLSGLAVVHCSPYNYQFTNSKSAIWKTSARIWGNYPTLKFIELNREYARGL